MGVAPPAPGRRAGRSCRPGRRCGRRAVAVRKPLRVTVKTACSLLAQPEPVDQVALGEPVEGGDGEPDRVARLLGRQAVLAAGLEAVGQGHGRQCNCELHVALQASPCVGSHGSRPHGFAASLGGPVAMPEAPVHAPHGPLPEGGTVRPMTRWGTPVMHRPQQPVTSYDEELRTPGRRHGRHDVRRRRRRAGRLPDRRRPGGLRLRLPRRVRRAHRRRGVQPGARRCPRAATAGSTTATRAACPTRARSCECARPDYATRRPAPAWTASRSTFAGDGLLARCLQHETDHTRGTVFGDRLPTKAPQEAAEAAREGRRRVPGELAGLASGRPRPSVCSPYVEAVVEASRRRARRPRSFRSTRPASAAAARRAARSSASSSSGPGMAAS